MDEELSLVDAEKRFNAAEINLEFSKVRSPINGYISKINVRNKEQIIRNGDILTEIVPEDDKLKIEAQIQPKDIALSLIHI